MSYQLIGTGLAQALPFAITPLFTRLYSEQDFALYTSFYAVASVLVVGVGGRYQFAIVLPEKNTDALNVFSLSIYITIAYAFLLFIAILVIDAWVSHPLGGTIYFLAPYVLIFGIWTSFSYLSVRKKTFLQNATAKVLQSLFYVLVSIAVGFFKWSTLGLIIGRVAGVLASWLFLHQRSSIKIFFPRLRSLKKVAEAYKSYPKYGLVPAFLDIASVQGIILIITKFYSSGDLGYFGLTSLVLSAPIGLIGGSFKDVFYQKMTVLINRNEFDQAITFFLKSALGLFLLGLPVCCVIYLFGEEIFGLVFGEPWRRSGAFASIIALSFLIQLVVSPLSSVFNATNKLKVASLWQLLYFTSTFLTLGFCAFGLNLKIETLLSVYVFHEIILYLIYFAIQLRTLKKLL